MNDVYKPIDPEDVRLENLMETYVQIMHNEGIEAAKGYFIGLSAEDQDEIGAFCGVARVLYRKKIK